MGVVTSGGARDTDELIKEKIPLYFRGPGRGIRPGRNEVESVNRPVTVGGVLVRPGELVDLGDLGLGHFASENATHAFPARVHV